jgi:hypothetical protein
MKIQKRLERKVSVLYISAKPFHCICKKILPFLWLQPNACIVAEIQSVLVFCKFIVNSKIVISFHHTKAMKYRLKGDEIERQLNCKKCDVRSHSLVFRGIPRKGAIQLHDGWVGVGEAYIYIKQVRKKYVY